MNMSKILYQTNAIVKEILEKDTKARNSDTYLYLQVLYRVGQLKGIDVNTMKVPDFLSHRSTLGFPNYETVSRSRRKLQAEHPELAGNDEVEAHRIVNEKTFRDYAKNKLKA